MRQLLKDSSTFAHITTRDESNATNTRHRSMASRALGSVGPRRSVNDLQIFMPGPEPTSTRINIVIR